MSSPMFNPADLPKTHKVLLVDNFPVVFDGLAKVLNVESGFVICRLATTFAEALEALAECQPNVILIELVMRDGDGLELIKQIKAQQKAVPVVVFTELDESVGALRVLQAGGQGYVSKQEPTEKVLSAIQTVLNGGYAVSPEISTRFLQSILRSPASPSSTPVETLAGQESKVFELLGMGVKTREIAARLGISVKTVDTYRARIKEKLQLPDTAALVREAVRWNDSRRREYV